MHFPEDYVKLALTSRKLNGSQTTKSYCVATVSWWDNAALSRWMIIYLLFGASINKEKPMTNYMADLIMPVNI